MYQALLLLLLCTSALAGELLVDGGEFPITALQDQHNESHAIGSDTRRVIFAASKHASQLVNDYLSTQSDNYLESRNTEFLADISEMPKIISSMFALPKMRDYPYRVLLASEAETLAMIPRREDAITLMTLRDRQVTDISFATSSKELAAFFNLPTQP